MGASAFVHAIDDDRLADLVNALAERRALEQ
jgi:hypothetical protein